MLGAEVLVDSLAGLPARHPAGCGRRPPVRAHRPRGRERGAGAACGQPAWKRSASGVGRPWRTSSSKTRWWPKPPGSRNRAWPREDRLEAELELGRQSPGDRRARVACRQAPASGTAGRALDARALPWRPAGRCARRLPPVAREARRGARHRSLTRAAAPRAGDPRHDKELDLPEARASVPASEPDRRKTVTILFADLVDSTELGARLDPEVLRRVLDRYFELVREQRSSATACGRSSSATRRWRSSASSRCTRTMPSRRSSRMRASGGTRRAERGAHRCARHPAPGPGRSQYGGGARSCCGFRRILRHRGRGQHRGATRAGRAPGRDPHR